MMLLIIRNKFFFISVALIVFQQCLIGLSTYWIGLAGMDVASGGSSALGYIIMFFSAVALAYLLGATSLYFRTKLSNSSWEFYYKSVIDKISSDLRLSSDKNKTSTQAWLGGEALSTLEEASFAFVEIIAIYCNVIFTLIALFVVLGFSLSGVILLSMVSSIILLTISKKRIAKLAHDIQSQKLKTLSAINKLWDNSFYGNTDLAFRAKSTADKRASEFFYSNEKYKLIEQIIACAPILISIPLLILSLHFEVNQNGVLLGAIVATLPRSLQLFQNIHAASMSTGQLILLKNKLSNIERFVDSLYVHDFYSNISDNSICIKSHGDGMSFTSPDAFIKFLDGGSAVTGRFLITGRNGSGKSSLLKSIKSIHAEAILLGPNIELGDEDIIGSTGQRQISMLEMFLPGDGRILLLDEWDGNLDSTNVKRINEWLDFIAESNVVVEVRHSDAIARV
jgi:hypothetical protein